MWNTYILNLQIHSLTSIIIIITRRKKETSQRKHGGYGTHKVSDKTRRRAKPEAEVLKSSIYISINLSADP